MASKKRKKIGRRLYNVLTLLILIILWIIGILFSLLKYILAISDNSKYTDKKLNKYGLYNWQKEEVKKGHFIRLDFEEDDEEDDDYFYDPLNYEEFFDNDSDDW